MSTLAQSLSTKQSKLPVATQAVAQRVVRPSAPLAQPRFVGVHKSAQPASQLRASAAVAEREMVNAAVPEIKITKKSAIESVKGIAGFSLDDYLAGKSRTWTFWDCDPSEFPWEYSQVEYAYVVAGQFYVTYPGGEPVEINAGDFVRFPVGKTEFKVTVPVRKFFTLTDE